MFRQEPRLRFCFCDLKHEVIGHTELVPHVKSSNTDSQNL